MAKKKKQVEETLLTELEEAELDQFEKTILITEGANAGRIKPEVSREDVARYTWLKDKEAGKMVEAPVNDGIAKDVVRAEREFRRYVKPSGGLVKGLSEEGVKRAEALKVMLNRAEYKWDESIRIDGMAAGTSAVFKETPQAGYVTFAQLTQLLETLKAGLKAELLEELTK